VTPEHKQHLIKAGESGPGSIVKPWIPAPPPARFSSTASPHMTEAQARAIFSSVRWTPSDLANQQPPVVFADAVAPSWTDYFDAADDEEAEDEEADAPEDDGIAAGLESLSPAQREQIILERQRAGMPAFEADDPVAQRRKQRYLGQSGRLSS
jgi:hypothetical protein